MARISNGQLYVAWNFGLQVSFLQPLPPPRYQHRNAYRSAEQNSNIFLCQFHAITHSHTSAHIRNCYLENKNIYVWVSTEQNCEFCSGLPESKKQMGISDWAFRDLNYFKNKPQECASIRIKYKYGIGLHTITQEVLLKFQSIIMKLPRTIN
jgi:hypothetical protein